MLGAYKVGVRLTVDLIPTVTVIVHREGEAPAVTETQSAPEEAAEQPAAAE